MAGTNLVPEIGECQLIRVSGSRFPPGYCEVLWFTLPPNFG